jgi:hypothetical protein
VATGAALAGLAAMAAGQQGASDAANPMAVPAKQWGTDAVLNELKVLDYGRNYLRYQMHTRDSKGDLVRDVMESKQGPVARLVMKEGRALTPEEDANERARLQAMLDSPDAFARHIRNENSGKKLASELIKQLPEAMIFSYTPGQPQRAGHAADSPAEIVIDFKPNPDWHPPTLTAEALTGLQGRAWIDAKTHFLTRTEGDIFRGVNFGFGFVAHIYPGGKLEFDQVHVSGERWIYSNFTENAMVRVLFKTIKEDTHIEGADFTPIPEMSYQEAVQQLLAMPVATK